MPTDWHIGRLKSANKRVSCLVRKEQNGFRVLSYETLSSDNHYSLRSGDNTEPDLRLDGSRRYSVGGGWVYLGMLRQAPSGGLNSHREPTWMRSAVA